eukprot:1145010-Pelagomonas_calceolata.AAC.1
MLANAVCVMSRLSPIENLIQCSKPQKRIWAWMGGTMMSHLSPIENLIQCSKPQKRIWAWMGGSMMHLSMSITSIHEAWEAEMDELRTRLVRSCCALSAARRAAVPGLVHLVQVRATKGRSEGQSRAPSAGERRNCKVSPANVRSVVTGRSGCWQGRCKI